LGLLRSPTGASPLATKARCPYSIDTHHTGRFKSRLDFKYPFDKAVSMISMSTFHAMLIPILAGMLLLAVGFNFRDKNAGVFAMWIGMLTILATVVIKILAKLNE
jgi:hypothetical protein